MNITKQHELTINISPLSRTNIITNTTFFSMDVKTGKKIINFTRGDDALNLSNATVMLGFDFVESGVTSIIDSTDGSVVIESASRGICSVILPNYIYNYSGRVLIHVYIMFEDGRSLDAGVIVTEFEESWLDSELVEMENFYVKRFEDLANELQAKMEEIKKQLMQDVQDALDELEERVETSEEFRGPQGEPGADGFSPIIGDNGNWFDANGDTDVLAIAETLNETDVSEILNEIFGGM